MNINIPFAPIYLFICEYLNNILSLGINFNLEFINTKGDVGHAMTDLVGRYESSSSSSSSFSQPCAFLGAMSSVVSSSTSTLNNLNGYPQISGYSTSTVRTWYMAHNSFFFLFHILSIPVSALNAIRPVRFSVFNVSRSLSFLYVVSRKSHRLPIVCTHSTW